MNLLIFDSDTLFPHMLSSYLQQRRFDVQRATHYGQVAEVVAMRPPGVILANRFTHGIDVYDFLRRHAESLPVILYSDIIYDREKLLMANAAGVVRSNTTAILYQLLYCLERLQA